MKNVRRSILDNGLRLLYRKRDSEIVWIWITVEVGSQYEKGFHRGIAHMLEHVIMGPEKYGQQSKLSKYDATYGTWTNAGTDRTTTEFTAVCPKAYYKRILEMFAERMKNPVFDDEFLKNEKSVIIKEINVDRDDVDSAIFDMQAKHLFKKQPFSNPVIGSKRDVKAMTKDELMRFHRKYYTPENMHIVLNGICKGYKETVQRYFDMPATGKKIVRPQYRIKPRKQSLVLYKDIEQPKLTMGNLLPPYPARETYATDIIEWILCNSGISSRLYQEIREKRGLSYGIEYEPHDNYCSKMIYLTIGCESKDIRKVERIYLKELKKLRNISDGSLKKAQKAMRGALKLQADDIHNETNCIAYYEEIGDVKLFNEFSKRISKVTKEDIRRTVDDYLLNYCKVVVRKKN
jgi:predicted Zn-dependent peptidase